ncbi:MAG: transposase, partial [Puniceicoccales bacterium]
LPWDYFEKEFEGLYSEEGRPAKPIRLMVGLLLLKQLENLSDERVCEAWRRDPYMQYWGRFARVSPSARNCGEEFFRWNQSSDPTDLIYFRKRLGEEEVEKIFAASAKLHQ